MIRGVSLCTHWQGDAIRSDPTGQAHACKPPENSWNSWCPWVIATKHSSEKMATVHPFPMISGASKVEKLPKSHVYNKSAVKCMKPLWQPKNPLQLLGSPPGFVLLCFMAGSAMPSRGCSHTHKQVQLKAPGISQQAWRTAINTTTDGRFCDSCNSTELLSRFREAAITAGKRQTEILGCALGVRFT